MTTNQNQSTDYHTLTELRQRKAQLLEDIAKDDKRVKALWAQLFYRPKTNDTPSQRITNMITTGGGILDGLILGWKLYRKFGKKGSIRIFGRRFCVGGFLSNDHLYTYPFFSSLLRSLLGKNRMAGHDGLSYKTED